MIGGQERNSNPPLAVSASIYLLNSPETYSESRSQTSKQKTRWNGFTSYRARTTVDRTCWRRSVPLIAPHWKTITISENTGDVMVGNRPLRNVRVAGWDSLRFFTVISRDRSDLIFDRSKSRSRVSGFPVGWWVKWVRVGTLENVSHRSDMRDKCATSQGYQRKCPKGSARPPL